MRSMALHILIVFTMYITSHAIAQTNEITLRYQSIDNSGPQTLYESHEPLDNGISLQSLNLELDDQVKALDIFELKAHGFGVDPYRNASLYLGKKGKWRFKLDYNRRRTLFDGQYYDREGSAQDWAQSRIKARFTYDGMKAIRWGFQHYSTKRAGVLSKPFYGLGQAYFFNSDVNDKNQETSLFLETRSLPIKLSLEGGYAKLDRSYENTPANGGLAQDGVDPDVLSDMSNTSIDEDKAPIFRITASWSGKRSEIIASGLSRRSSGSTVRNDLTSYLLDGGNIGGVGIGTLQSGDVDQDTTFGNLRYGYNINDQWTVRFFGEMSDVKSDNNISGEQRLLMFRSDQSIVISEAFTTQTAVEHSDREVGAEAEWRKDKMGITLSVQDRERDLDWQFNDTRVQKERGTQQWSISSWWKPNKKVKTSIGAEVGSFSGELYRTDPETVNRIWARCQMKLNDKFSLRTSVKTEESDNDEAQLDRESTSINGSLVYAFKNRVFVIGADYLDLTSQTDIVFYAPDLTQGLSTYDSEQLHLNVYGAWPFSERLKLVFSGYHQEDSGASFPFENRGGQLQLEMNGPANSIWQVFVQQRDYDHETFDYQVSRFGLSLGMRF